MLPKIYDGSGLPAPARTELRAGALSVTYENGSLRYIRLGDREILRGVYAAVRDHNWGTIPAQLSDVTFDARADSFDIAFTSDHRLGGIHFVWRGTISGSADGVIRFTFDGESLTAFRRNRIGFCILHPMALAGAGCALEHVDGSREEAAFPAQIAPHQPFFDLRAITHEVLPGARAEVRMEGDTFETEDQRNWTDASYKTYCTPLGLPYPVEVAAGAEVRQSVTVRLIGQPTTIRVAESQPTLHIDLGSSRPLPALGLAAASDGQPLTAREIERLKALHLAHLRLDLNVDDALEAALRRATDDARALGCGLEIALDGSSGEAELRQVRAAVDALGTPVVRWLILDPKPASREQIALARRVLGTDGVPLGAGTNGYFTQLNRQRPPADLIDLLAYSLNPQVHAFDNASLVETLPTQAATVASARAFSGGARVAVSPVTLRIRWNPDATAPETSASGTLPRPVDPRQASLFGAAWALGSLKALAVADSATYFETVGWLGVMERESGSPLPDLFPSVAGGVFPMYHVFADVGAFASGSVLNTLSSDPLRFDGLALRKNGALRVLVANFTQERQSVTLDGLSGRFALRGLDEISADAAIRTPEAFRAASGVVLGADKSGLRVELLPYALLTLDQVS